MFLANYAEQKDISADDTLAAILTAARRRCGRRVEAANAPANKDALKQQTEEAMARGLFGAPSFVVGDELFWGNDRLETALAWATSADEARGRSDNQRATCDSHASLD